MCNLGLFWVPWIIFPSCHIWHVHVTCMSQQKFKSHYSCESVGIQIQDLQFVRQTLCSCPEIWSQNKASQRLTSGSVVLTSVAIFIFHYEVHCDMPPSTFVNLKAGIALSVKFRNLYLLQTSVLTHSCIPLCQLSFISVPLSLCCTVYTIMSPELVFTTVWRS